MKAWKLWKRWKTISLRENCLLSETEFQERRIHFYDNDDDTDGDRSRAIQMTERFWTTNACLSVCVSMICTQQTKPPIKELALGIVSEFFKIASSELAQAGRVENLCDIQPDMVLYTVEPNCIVRDLNFVFANTNPAIRTSWYKRLLESGFQETSLWSFLLFSFDVIVAKNADKSSKALFKQIRNSALQILWPHFLRYCNRNFVIPSRLVGLPRCLRGQSGRLLGTKTPHIDLAWGALEKARSTPRSSIGNVLDVLAEDPAFDGTSVSNGTTFVQKELCASVDCSGNFSTNRKTLYLRRPCRLSSADFILFYLLRFV